jgi:electron-transferring-flavoprotein dehydrogenase
MGVGRQRDELTAFPEAFEKSWVRTELHKGRNFKPLISKGLRLGSFLFGVDQVLFRGRAPWTLKHGHTDHASLKPKSGFKPIEYPKPDGEITFDRLTNVSFSATNHEENQPVHLVLKDESVAIDTNLAIYDAPEQRYCPAQVYEIVTDDDGSNPRLQINAQNCVHCKTCDIKDPTQNINWVPPEGGGGPNYPNM